MKIITLLFTFMVLLNFTSASERISGANRRINLDNYDFMRGQVYVKKPRGRVLTGTFQFPMNNQFPDWIEPPYIASNDEERIYVRILGGNGFVGNLVPFREGVNNDFLRGYHFYIQLPNNVLLHAGLQPYTNYAINIPRSTRVYVRLPGQPHVIYSGALTPLRGNRPSWLPHEY